MNRLVAPKQEDINTVTSWLEQHGIVHEVTYSRDFLYADGTVEQFETLLETSFNLYEHSSSGNTKVQ